MLPSEYQTLEHIMQLFFHSESAADIPPVSLYGESTLETDVTDAASYRLSNETGTGHVTFIRFSPVLSCTITIFISAIAGSVRIQSKTA